MAFKTLLSGIRCKYEFIKYYTPCRGSYHLHNYRMLTEPVNTIFFHKLENEGLIRVTIFLAPKRFRKGLVTVNKQLQGTVATVLSRIHLKVRNLLRDRKKTDKEVTDCDYLNDVDLLLNGEPVDKSVYCSTIFDLDGELSLKIFDDDYLCKVNEPYITRLKIDDAPVAGTFAYPLRLDALATNKFDFKWFRRASKNENWTEIGTGSHYLVVEDDISHHLKLECVPSNENATGTPVVQITQNKVESQLCSYYYHNTHKLTEEGVKEDMFRLVTYNVLADYYATTKTGVKLFDYCPKEAMQKNQRFSAIAIELCGYKSDLICLQEVDMDVYNMLWQPLFEMVDFTSKICLKDSSPEGTLFLFKNRKFELLCSENYIFALEILRNPALHEICSFLMSNSTLYSKVTSLKHSLQLTALQSKIKTDEVVVIGNLHLYSHFQGEGIRIIQLAAAFKLLNCLLLQLKPSLLNKNVSCILCGDFNSEPSSTVHDYIKNSIINATVMENECVSPPITQLNHPLKMESAYETPTFTNYTRDFKGCLDYIYYETDKLEVDKVYPTASEEILSAHTGIPSVAFPSDHLPLIADFKWKS